MKINIEKRVLTQALAEVMPFIPIKGQILPMKFALITIKGKRMKIEANNGEIGIHKYVELLNSESDGKFCLPIADMIKYVSKIDGDITISVCKNAVIVEHECGKCEYQTISVDEYPIFSLSEEDAQTVIIDASIIARSIERARNFVAQDVLRPQLSAIYAYINNNIFGFCATDTHKLVNGEIRYSDNSAADLNWYIMPSVFAPLIAVCKSGGEVEICVYDKSVSFKKDSTTIYTNLYSANFPNFKRVIPQTSAIRCELNKQNLYAALQRLALCVDRTTRCVKLTFDCFNIRIEANDLSNMRYSTENISDIDCTGNITIGANVDNLIQCIQSLSDDRVVIEMTDSTRALVMKNTSNQAIVTLTMPMSIV